MSIASSKNNSFVQKIIWPSPWTSGRIFNTPIAKLVETTEEGDTESRISQANNSRRESINAASTRSVNKSPWTRKSRRPIFDGNADTVVRVMPLL